MKNYFYGGARKLLAGLQMIALFASTLSFGVNMTNAVDYNDVIEIPENTPAWTEIYDFGEEGWQPTERFTCEDYYMNIEWSKLKLDYSPDYEIPWYCPNESTLSFSKNWHTKLIKMKILDIYDDDTDKDGILDNVDDDIDGDGILNENDIFPKNPNIEVDTLDLNNTADCNLGDAVKAVNTNTAVNWCNTWSVDKIKLIVITVPWTILLKDTLNINTDIEISGHPDGTTLDGTNLWNKDGFLIDFGSRTARLKDLEIQNFSKTAINITDAGGGEVFLDNLNMYHNNQVLNYDVGGSYEWKVESWMRDKRWKVYLNNSLIEDNNSQNNTIYVNECLNKEHEEVWVSLYIKNSLIRNNTAKSPIIDSDCGHLVINDSTFQGNTTESKGIIYTGYGVKASFFQYGERYGINGFMASFEPGTKALTEIYNSTFVNNNGENTLYTETFEDFISEGNPDNLKKSKSASEIYLKNNTFSEKNITGNIINATDIGEIKGTSNINDEITNEETSKILIKNNIFQGKTGIDNCNFGTSNLEIANNISSDGSCGFEVYGGKDNATDINLKPLTDNGGKAPLGPNGLLGNVLTLAIDENSSAYNAGENTSCMHDDQIWVSRPQYDTCDVGAFEYLKKESLVFTGSTTVTATGSFACVNGNSDVEPLIYTGTGTMTATGTSQEEADQKAYSGALARAQKDVADNGQNYADARLVCDFTGNGTYTKTGSIQKNNCKNNEEWSFVEVSVTKTATATGVTQTGAIEKANQLAGSKALAEFETTKQNIANEQWTCMQNIFTGSGTFTASGVFVRDNCDANSVGWSGTVEKTATATATGATQDLANALALEKAKKKAKELLALEGQDDVNANTSCAVKICKDSSALNYSDKTIDGVNFVADNSLCQYPDPIFTGSGVYVASGSFECSNGISGSGVYTATGSATATGTSQANANSLALEKAKKIAEDDVATNGQNTIDASTVCTPWKVKVCKDEKATNYSDVKVGEVIDGKIYKSENSLCKYNPVSICKDAKALNYSDKVVDDKLFNKDNSLCKYPKPKEPVKICTDLKATNLSKEKVDWVNFMEDNSLCKYPTITTTTGHGGGYDPELPPATPLTGSVLKKIWKTSVEINTNTNVKGIIFDTRCEDLIKNLDELKAKTLYYKTFIQNTDDEYVNQDITWGQFKRVLEKYESLLKNTDSISEALRLIRKNMNEDVEREIAAKILISSLQKRFSTADYFPILPKPIEITTFDDVNPMTGTAPYIQQAYNLCLLHGRKTRDGVPLNTRGEKDSNAPRLFEPRSGITIAETIKILINMSHSWDHIPGLTGTGKK